MPGAAEIHVEGQKELERAFRRLRKEVLADLRPTLVALAEPVRRTAEVLAVQEITNIGDQWGRMRIGATVRGVYVAPRSRNRGGSRRPNFAGLLMSRAMEPALDQHKEKILAEFDAVINISAAKAGW